MGLDIYLCAIFCYDLTNRNCLGTSNFLLVSILVNMAGSFEYVRQVSENILKFRSVHVAQSRSCFQASDSQHPVFACQPHLVIIL